MGEMDTWWEAMIDALFEGAYFVDRDRRVLLWNKAAERITGYRAEEVLNRRCSEAVLCHIDSTGASLCALGCPLSRVMSDRGLFETDAWVAHREGHRVPVRVRTQAVLDRAGQVVGAVELFDLAPAVNQENTRSVVYATMMTDPMTGAASERVASAALQTRLRQTAHEGIPFGVCVIAIDRLIWARSTYGDGAAIELTRLVARTLVTNVGPSEIVARLSDELFVLVLSGADDLPGRADRLRMLVEKSALSLGGETVRTTVSIGAVVSEASDSPEGLMERALVLMEHSRSQGGGCVSVQPSRVHRLPIAP